MTDPNLTILYVNDPTTSAAFYADLLEKQPIEASPTFAMFALSTGSLLGLWSRQTVEPSASFMGGGAEVAFAVQSKQEVDTLHRNWSDRGLTILQQPTQMDFGHTFVASDPDGHRLRVFFPME